MITEASCEDSGPISEFGSKPSHFFATRLLQECPHAAAQATIAATSCLLFWLTWAHWGDIQADCGRELYVPNQILHGKMLYRDLWYSYGPLEPYLSALLLKLFGQHLSVLYLFGLTLATSSALVVFEIGGMVESRAVGLAAALTLLLQGFQPSIFNYIFPWSYAGSLGLLLSLLCVFFGLGYVLQQREMKLIFAGLSAGLALLCKQEFGISCYALLALVLVIQTAQKRSMQAFLWDLYAFTPGLLISTVIYGWFFWKLTPDVVFDNWYGPKRYFVQNNAPHLYATTGLRFVPIEMFLLLSDAALAIFSWSWIAKLCVFYVERLGWRHAAVILFIVGLALAVARQFAPLTMYTILAILIYPRGMFFIGCAFFAVTLYRLVKSSDDRRLLSELALSVFALALASRVMTEIVPAAYSIFYDMPLVLIFLMVIARCVRVAARSLSLEPRRNLINFLLIAEVLMFSIIVVPGKSGRTARLDTSWGPIYLQPADTIVAKEIIDFASQQRRRNRQVAYLPELPMLYAITGTEAPSRLYTLLPGFLAPWQEHDYIADLTRAAPYYIVLTSRNMSEYGASYFGIDYDQEVYRWIDLNYRVIGEFGRFRRDKGRLLTALLYERRSTPSRPLQSQSHIPAS